MPVIDIVVWAIIAWFAVGCALAIGRFIMLRSTGTQVLVRPMPAKDSYSWRHGIVRYNAGCLEFFKLRSVWPTADLSLNRLDVEIVSTRQLLDDEANFMPEASEAIHIRVDGKEYEIAVDGRGAMALTAWIESAPSRRKENINLKQLRERAERSHRKHDRR